MTNRREAILSPQERQAEVIFGLIMALSITGSLSVASSGRSEVRAMLIGAIGCNTAWGIVDALMYLVAVLVERYHGLRLFHAVRAEKDVERAHRMIADRLPPLLAEHVSLSELVALRRKLVEMGTPPRAGLTRRDLLGALAVFLLVFLSTLPVVVPFLLPLEPRVALRFSNGIALVMLFVLGWRMGRYVAGPPVFTGLAAVGVGAALVWMTIALGG